MNRIDEIFADLRRRRGRALMPFLTAGDPDLVTTQKLLGAIEHAGASVCELGIPFSDPIADGPVIQASMSYALDRGIKPSAILNMVAQQRARLKMGLVAMVSYSIVHRMASGTFLRDCKAAGIDGVIIPDLPVEESAAVRDQVTKADMVCSFLIAPTTPIGRRSAKPILPAPACATAFGESSGTGTNRPAFRSSRSTEMIVGSSVDGVVETNSVASANP